MMRKKKSTEGMKAKSNENANDLCSIEELLKGQSELGLAQTVFEPPDEAVARLSVIPLLFDEPVDCSSETGSVAYDSWADGPAVTLRDITDGHVRRLRLRAGKVSLEIVAERTAGHWEFVARVCRRAAVAHNFVLQVGRKKLLSESGGFFRWTSKSVPHRIGLASFRQTYTFERVPW